jgi:hypothetical protein
MGNARSTKRDIERARLERAAAKRERRQTRAPVDHAPTADRIGASESQDEVLAALAALHESFARGALQFAEFEAGKIDLMERLRVE